MSKTMDFMIIGLPRSGTTWAANWLSSDGAICYHDPFSHWDDAQISAHDPGLEWGISCTGAWLFPSFLAQNPCRTVILERDLSEVNASLRDIRLPEINPALMPLFSAAPGKRMPFSDLFDEEGAREIWQHLRPGRRFDLARWQMLREMRIEPNFDVWKPDQAIISRMSERIAK